MAKVDRKLTPIWIKIRDQLRRLHLSQADLASGIGRTPVRVSKWVTGEGLPVGIDLVNIADFLGTSVRFLVDDDMEEDTGDPRGGDALGLTEEERQVVRMARALGPDEALRRLLVTGAAVQLAGKPPPRALRYPSPRPLPPKPLRALPAPDDDDEAPPPAPRPPARPTKTPAKAVRCPAGPQTPPRKRTPKVTPKVTPEVTPEA